jgi:predicted small lipoprotein YifL
MLGISILGASQGPRVARALRRALLAMLPCASVALAGCGQPGPLYLPVAPAASVPAYAMPSSMPGSAPAAPGKPASAPGA